MPRDSSTGRGWCSPGAIGSTRRGAQRIADADRGASRATPLEATDIPGETAPMLTHHGDGIWSCTQAHRFVGIHLPVRMTVIRLAAGDVIVHSPVALSEPLRAAVDAVGPVRWVVAPNRFHHLHAGEWAQAYPDAALLGAPGLARKRKDLTFGGVLPADAPDAWAGELVCQVLEGSKMMGELVFLHRPSRTLICSDLVFNLGRGETWWTRCYQAMAGTGKQPAISRMFVMAMSDRPACMASARALCEWDFDRVLMGHGDAIEAGGKEQLRALFG